MLGTSDIAGGGACFQQLFVDEHVDTSKKGSLQLEAGRHACSCPGDICSRCACLANGYIAACIQGEVRHCSGEGTAAAS